MSREHETSQDCWCGPTPIAVRRDDGSVGHVYAHHEPGPRDPADEADRLVHIAEAINEVRHQTQEDYQ
jgi:hypothetical protein